MNLQNRSEDFYPLRCVSNGSALSEKLPGSPSFLWPNLDELGFSALSVVEAKKTKNVCRACCIVGTYVYVMVYVNDLIDGALILGIL